MQMSRYVRGIAFLILLLSVQEIQAYEEQL
jgi:hypothetical protein